MNREFFADILEEMGIDFSIYLKIQICAFFAKKGMDDKIRDRLQSQRKYAQHECDSLAERGLQHRKPKQIEPWEAVEIFTYLLDEIEGHFYNLDCLLAMIDKLGFNNANAFHRSFIVDCFYYLNQFERLLYNNSHDNDVDIAMTIIDRSLNSNWESVLKSYQLTSSQS
jgi:hypothetical protein